MMTPAGVALTLLVLAVAASAGGGQGPHPLRFPAEGTVVKSAVRTYSARPRDPTIALPSGLAALAFAGDPAAPDYVIAGISIRAPDNVTNVLYEVAVFDVVGDISFGIAVIQDESPTNQTLIVGFIDPSQDGPVLVPRGGRGTFGGIWDVTFLPDRRIPRRHRQPLQKSPFTVVFSQRGVVSVTVTRNWNIRNQTFDNFLNVAVKWHRRPTYDVSGLLGNFTGLPLPPLRYPLKAKVVESSVKTFNRLKTTVPRGAVLPLPAPLPNNITGVPLIVAPDAYTFLSGTKKITPVGAPRPRYALAGVALLLPERTGAIVAIADTPAGQAIRVSTGNADTQVQEDLQPGDTVTLPGGIIFKYHALTPFVSAFPGHHRHPREDDWSHSRDLRVSFILPGMVTVEATREYNRRARAYAPWINVEAVYLTAPAVNVTGLLGNIVVPGQVSPP